MAQNETGTNATNISADANVSNEPQNTPENKTETITVNPLLSDLRCMTLDPRFEHLLTQLIIDYNAKYTL